MNQHHAVKTLSALALILAVSFASAQCPDCTADPDCTSTDGFPTLCPAELANGTTGESYLELLTFYLPETVVDPGTGIEASLLEVAVTSITGVPLGLEFDLDEADATYEPASGQTSGCAHLCGVPLIPGGFTIQIEIAATVSALGFEQVVNESFSLAILIEAGAGGTASFTYDPAVGCGPLEVDFEASLSGNAAQITTWDWAFEAGSPTTSDLLAPQGVIFSEPGAFNVQLTTTISNQVLNTVQLTSTGGGGWDDFFTDPDPYFVLIDGNGNAVYTSSFVGDATSANWTGLGLVLSNPPYTIAFYDDDILDNDALGSGPLNLEGLSSSGGAGSVAFSASPSYGTVLIGLQTEMVITDSAEVWVMPSPLVPLVLSAAGDSVLCENTELTEVQWIMDGQVVSFGQELAYVPQENGWVTAVGIAPGGCTGASDSLLFCQPDSTFALTISVGGDTLQAPGGFSSYSWWVGDSLLGTWMGSAATLFAPEANGWYAVSVTDAFGCPAASSASLFCGPSTAPELELTGDSLIVSGYDLPILTWMDEVGVPIDGAGGQTVFYPDSSGWYSVLSSDSVGCYSYTAPVLFCADIDSPVILLNADGNLEATAGYDVYAWSLDGDALPDETGPLIVNPLLGVYVVFVADHLDCPFVFSDGIDTGIPFIGDGGGANDEPGHWQLFPVPFTESISLNWLPNAPAESRWTATLYSVSGQCIKAKRNIHNHGTIHGLIGLPRGLYLLVLESEAGKRETHLISR